jgi:GTP-binding protein Era
LNDTGNTVAGFRCGYVAIVGEPNVGKSTLMNRLLGQKISIVTRKPQTTRHKILGILSNDSAQMIFLDTPGIITPHYALHEAMMRSAGMAIADADIVCLMIDASDSGSDDPASHGQVFERLAAVQKPVHLVINKTDLVQKQALLPIIDAFARRFRFGEILPVSGLTGDGVGELLRVLERGLPEHPPLYPPDIVSDHQERFFVAEIIREKIFIALQDEVPYATTVDIVEFKERTRGKWFISADVYVERDSQKGIVIGKGGAKLREIGSHARKDIEAFLQTPVFLELHVKVREGWREQEEWLKRLGYGPP